MPELSIRVTSEIGRLRRVLVHEPGQEVDHMVPATMDELLFDDVVFGDRAREEHALFRRVLQLLGIEPVEARDLLTQSLKNEEARGWVTSLLSPGLPQVVADQMQEAEASQLAEMLTAGVRTGGDGVEVQDLFAVAPLPNWCFQRDPQIVVGDGVIMGAMASTARHREALLSRVIFRFHPDLRSVPMLHDPLEQSPEHHLFVEQHRPRLEGGDVLVLSPDVLAVGSSQRTNHTAIGGLARCLSGRADGPRWLVIVGLPARRAYMHLDTVLTPVDRGAALVYPPVIQGEGPERARVQVVDLHSPDAQPVSEDGLLPALAKRGIDLEPIACGGKDPLRQQREQWTDGANALALAPGVIVLYERNVATTEELARHGFSVVRARDLVLGRAEVDLESGRRVCVLIPSHELSRARGGPHCLTHPLERDPVSK